MESMKLMVNHCMLAMTAADVVFNFNPVFISHFLIWDTCSLMQAMLHIMRSINKIVEHIEVSKRLLKCLGFILFVLFCSVAGAGAVLFSFFGGTCNQYLPSIVVLGAIQNRSLFNSLSNESSICYGMGCHECAGIVVHSASSL